MPTPLKRLAENSSFVGGSIATMIKSVGKTLRFEIEDESGMLTREETQDPVIWVSWHNRVFILPSFYKGLLPSRTGKVMTSASRDG